MERTKAQEAVYVCVQKHLLIVLISHEMFVLLSLWEQIYVYVCVLRRVSVISIFSHIWSISICIICCHWGFLVFKSLSFCKSF